MRKLIMRLIEPWKLMNWKTRAKVLLVLFLMGFLTDQVLRPQSLAAPARGVTSTQTVGTCPAPASGTTWYCETFAGPYVSLNGAAYIPIPLSVPAIPANVVTAVTVNGGAPLTGPTVALTIPTTVKLNAITVTPTGTIQ